MNPHTRLILQASKTNYLTLYKQSKRITEIQRLPDLIIKKKKKKKILFIKRNIILDHGIEKNLLKVSFLYANHSQLRRCRSFISFHLIPPIVRLARTPRENDAARRTAFVKTFTNSIRSERASCFLDNDPKYPRDKGGIVRSIDVGRFNCYLISHCYGRWSKQPDHAIEIKAFSTWPSRSHFRRCRFGRRVSQTFLNFSIKLGCNQV